MFKIILLLQLVFTVGFSVRANTILIYDTLFIREVPNISSEILNNNTLSGVNEKVKFKRAKVIVLTIFTGFLGGHRIYLGTHQRTPIIYAVTLGGFGILPLIDLVNLILKKDISIYENKSQIMMWRKE